MPLYTPIVFVVFNRPETTRAVFRAIAACKPQKLLVIADAPRPGRPRDEALCTQVRSIVSQVDWPCEVLTNFAETNLGCEARVTSGLSWAFSLVEDAIILEDDCLPDQTFFRYCQELLDRYRGDTRVGMISGNNFAPLGPAYPYSYHFSRFAHIWGWATWRSAWQRYDQHLQSWQTVKRDGILREVYSRNAERKYWTQIFDSMYYKKGPDTWDYQWNYTSLTNNLLLIVPSVNMVKNIGFGPDATHTHSTLEWAESAEAKSTEFPLKHPPYMIPMRSCDATYQQVCFVPTFVQRLQRKLRYLSSRFTRSDKDTIAAMRSPAASVNTH